MSRIYKRAGSPHWYYTAGTGSKRVQRSTGTSKKRIAKLIQEKWDEELILRKWGIKTNHITIKKLKIEYMKIIVKRKSSSWARRIEILLRRFANQYAPLSPTDVTPQIVEEYISKRIDDTAAPKTIIEEIKALKLMFKHAISHNYSTTNPCDDAILPKLVRKRPRKEVPAKLVLKAIKSSTNPSDKAFWRLLLYTGLRTGDAGTLKKEDVKKDRIILKQKKTGREVVIPLHPTIDANKIISIMPPSRSGRSRERFKKLVGEGYDLHSIRHTFASELQANGGTKLQIKALLGHGTDSVTEEYVHHHFEELSELISKL